MKFVKWLFFDVIENAMKIEFNPVNFMAFGQIYKMSRFIILFVHFIVIIFFSYLLVHIYQTHHFFFHSRYGAAYLFEQNSKWNNNKVKKKGSKTFNVTRYVVCVQKNEMSTSIPLQRQPTTTSPIVCTCTLHIAYNCH